MRAITVVGAGILGLWQALTLARRGHAVCLWDREAVPFAAAASRYAGAMLAPDCEAESAPAVVRTLGRRGLELWAAAYPGLAKAGTLIVAAARDRSEIDRFARAVGGSRRIGRAEIGRLEPDLASFEDGLYFADEAHMTTPDALAFLLKACRDAGVEVEFGRAWAPSDADAARRQAGMAELPLVVDCRGLAAQSDIRALRGVRGERIIIRTREIALTRPVRLLHPRHPLYVVPWGDGRFMVGATVIESEDAGPASMRSCLELMGAAYALNPGFGEAEVVEVGAGVRPALSDNVPRAFAGPGGIIRVNGAYRHGFLLAPVLAEAVADWLQDGRNHPLIALAPAPEQ